MSLGCRAFRKVRGNAIHMRVDECNVSHHALVRIYLFSACKARKLEILYLSGEFDRLARG